MAPTIRTIASYSSHQEFSVDFFGNDMFVTVTETPSVIRRWIRDVVFHHRRSRSCHPLVVGVGVQWTPASYNPPEDNSPASYNHSDSSSPVSYNADSPPASYNNSGSSSPDNYNADYPRASYDPPADTLQLCVDKRCIIIQLSYCNRVPDALRRFLTNPRTTFVGVWNAQDARKLELCRHQLETGELMDLRKYVTDAAGRSLSRCSFGTIVEICMGFRGVSVDKEISRSDWGVDYLSLDQILQASLDAYVCYQLGVWVRLWEV